jgi:small subunit ribosomal protein S20
VPKIRSAKKRMRQSVKARERNRKQRATLRTAVRKVRGAASKEEAVAGIRTAEALLDRAARKRLIHPNAAARQKSRLAKAARTK